MTLRGNIAREDIFLEARPISEGVLAGVKEKSEKGTLQWQ